MVTRTAAVVGLMLAIGILPVIWSTSSVAAAILTGPSLLLLPVGLGLGVAYGFSGRWPSGVSVTQALIVGYFIGLFFLILSFVATERFLANPAQPSLMMAGVWTIALFGWLRIGTRFSIRLVDRRLAFALFVAAALLGGIRYAYTITIFSDFPITDLFQRIQFHGGAWAYARTLVLNPFFAASYIPSQQLQLGLLLRLTGADPLVAEWVWPVAMAPLQTAVLYAFFSKVLDQKPAAVLACCLALAQSGLSNPTNGTIAELASITILSLILTRAQEPSARGKAIALRFLALALGIAFGLILLKMPLEVSAFGALITTLVGGTLSSRRGWGIPTTIAMLTTVTLSFHRGALLYLSLSAVAAAAYYCFVLAQELGGTRAQTILHWLLIAVLTLAGTMTARILFLGDRVADAFGLWRIFDLVLMPLAGKSLAVVAIDGDLAPGAGTRVALFELARSVSPLVVGFVAAVMLLLSIAPIRRHWAFLERPEGRKTLAQTLIFLGLTCIILTGFPFIHRASFLIVLFSTAAAISIIAATPRPIYSQHLFTIAFAAYAVVIVGFVFIAAPAGVQPYLQRSVPIFLVLGAALVGVFFLPAYLPKRYRWQAATMLVIVVTAEFALSKTYFKPYAFRNQISSPSGALASFDGRDLAFGTYIANRTDGSEILASDPKTMTFIEGRTGISPLVSSSNLDTIDAGIRIDLITVLASLLTKESGFDVCLAFDAILNKRASGIFDYSRVRTQTPSLQGRSALEHLGYENRLVPSYNISLAEDAKQSNTLSDDGVLSFIVIINPTSLQWLSDPVESYYFPNRETLSQEVIAALNKHFDHHDLVENNYVATIKCKRIKG